jgi:hypothetical protein
MGSIPLPSTILKPLADFVIEPVPKGRLGAFCAPAPGQLEAFSAHRAYTSRTDELFADVLSTGVRGAAVLRTSAVSATKYIGRSFASRAARPR